MNGYGSPAGYPFADPRRGFPMDPIVTFFDGQNIFLLAKERFGAGYEAPDYEPLELATTISANLKPPKYVSKLYFYTGIHRNWKRFWSNKLRALEVKGRGILGRDNVEIFRKPLKYHDEVVVIRDNGTAPPTFKVKYRAITGSIKVECSTGPEVREFSLGLGPPGEVCFRIPTILPAGIGSITDMSVSFAPGPFPSDKIELTPISLRPQVIKRGAEKGVDLKLGLDVMKVLRQDTTVTSILLLSADSDFEELVKEVRSFCNDAGRRVEVYSASPRDVNGVVGIPGTVRIEITKPIYDACRDPNNKKYFL
jgi:uncharacterized LabA/DUF88 family protein